MEFKLRSWKAVELVNSQAVKTDKGKLLATLVTDEKGMGKCKRPELVINK